MAWIYLLIASVFEIGWTFSLKFLSISKLKSIHWRDFFLSKDNFLVLAPFAGYVLFGVGNIFFFSQAMKDLPTSTALAIWMGVSLIGVKLVDIAVFKESYTIYQFFYLGLILIGIVGLKRNG